MVGLTLLFVAAAVIVALLVLAVAQVAGVTRSEDRWGLPRVAAVVSLGTMVLTVVVTSWVTLTVLLASKLDVTVPIGELPVRTRGGLTFDPPPGARILSGGFDQVSVTAEGVGSTARIAFAASFVLAGATLIGVAWVVWRLARSLGKHDPFVLGSRSLTAVAVMVMTGGILSSVAGDLGGWAASHDLFAVSGWGAATTGPPPASAADLGWPEPAGFSLTIPFWPLAAGLVLELLASVFRYGAQLRRDAEGLV